MIKRISVFLVALVVLLTSLSTVAFAQAPYSGYVYNAWKKAIPSPTGYLPDEFFRGQDNELIGAFDEPTDMFVDHLDRIWVVDAGNNRLVAMDKDFNLIKVIDRVIYKGEEQLLNSPSSMYITPSGDFYIADTGNKCVWRINEETLEVELSYVQPKNEIYEFNKFEPIKIAVDASDILYVLCRDVNRGFVTFDKKGTFLLYFGTPKIEATAEVIAQSFWRQFMTQEQRDAALQYSPIEYKAIEIDSEGFIYATIYPEKADGKNQLKKLNAKGVGILKQRRKAISERSSSAICFGDRELRRLKGISMPNKFCDLKVNDDCTAFFMLDNSHGKVFAYDEECNFLYVFGGLGTQKGLFSNPVAIDMIGDIIYVLDQKTGAITSFEPTTFGTLVEKAALLYNLGEYEAAVEPWNEVLQYNSNYELAYSGLGKAELEKENYKLAMEYFKLAEDTNGYEDAFKEYREIVLKENFIYIFIVIVGAIIVYFVVSTVKKMKKKKAQGGRK